MSDDPNTPLALILIGGAAACFFMAARPWPQSGSKSVHPAAYAQSILEGQPLDAGPAPTNDTPDIEKGLAAILGIWALSKIAGAFGNVPQLFGPGEGQGESGDEGEGDDGGGEGILGDIEGAAKDVEGDLGEVGE